MTLDEIAYKHGTDKSPNGHWYTRYYERMFGPIREQVETLLEIGVGSGASLRVWMEYFPNALIYGLDMNAVTGDFGGRVSLLQCDQTDEDTLACYAGEKLEIIIDDASHNEEKTLASLTYLFPLLQPKGWYVIEDMDRGSFSIKIGAWLNEHREASECHIFSNRGSGSNILFIRKQA